MKEYIHIEGVSAILNIEQYPIIATVPRVVVKEEGDGQTEVHHHLDHQEGGQGGSRKEVEYSNLIQLPAARLRQGRVE